MFQICYYHQYACLLVCLSVSQTSMDHSDQGKYRATLEFKSSGCAVRDRQQITFVTLNGFRLLSKPPPHPPVLNNFELKENQPKLDEKSMSVSHCISNFQGAPYNKL